MNGGGFVVIRRALIEHPAFRTEGEAMQFAWLIARASWKPTRVRYKDRVIHLQRGQLAVSVRDMAAALDRPRSVIHRFLEKLKNQDMIKTDAGTGVLKVTICNYSKYQDYQPLAGTGSGTGSGTGAGQGRDIEQQEEQIKQDSTRMNPGKAKGFLPSDWKAPAISELTPKAQECAKQWPPGLYEREAEAFGLYWASEGKMKKDWRATWGNRIINQHWRIMQEGRQQAGRPAGEKKLYEHLAERQGRA